MWILFDIAFWLWQWSGWKALFFDLSLGWSEMSSRRYFHWQLAWFMGRQGNWLVEHRFLLRSFMARLMFLPPPFQLLLMSQFAKPKSKYIHEKRKETGFRHSSSNYAINAHQQKKSATIKSVLNFYFIMWEGLCVARSCIHEYFVTKQTGCGRAGLYT